MAVEAYTAMEIMVAKEFAPTQPRLFNIGTFHGGETNNVICNYCKMFASARTHSDEASDFLLQRVTEICEGIAKMNGGEAKVTVNKLLPYVLNHPVVYEKVNETARRVLGEENLIIETVRGLGGEDFGFLTRKKPCTIFNLGTRGDDPNTAKALHQDTFDIDERGMEYGIKMFIGFVEDHQDGFEME